MSDSDRNKSTTSMDDLMVKTVGMLDTLPDRISKAEEYIHQLEKDFALHDGEQKQGIKRISDRIDNIDSVCLELRGEVNKHIESVKNEIEKLGKIEGLTQEHKDLLNNLKNTVDILNRDYESRQSVKHTIWKYIVIMISHFTRYAMLPITISILLYIGFSERMIPGYTPPIETHTGDDFYASSSSLLNLVGDNCINESDLNVWRMNQDSNLIFFSENNNIRKSISDNSKINYTHIFIWMPKDKSKGGYVQMYGENENSIGNNITIIRGK